MPKTRLADSAGDLCGPVPYLLSQLALSPGKTTPVVFKAHNAGAPATFRIIAVDRKQFVGGVEPQELSLGTGETKTVAVEMAVPGAIHYSREILLVE